MNKIMYKIAAYAALGHCIVLLIEKDWINAMGLFGAFGAWSILGASDKSTEGNNENNNYITSESGKDWRA